jgi:hypothetical protein
MGVVLEVKHLCKITEVSAERYFFSRWKRAVSWDLLVEPERGKPQRESADEPDSPTSGEITYFGMPLMGNENEIKQRVGCATGGIHYYQRKKD